MLAVNSLGAGKHSDIVKKTTLGTLPAGPGHTDLLALVSNNVLVHPTSKQMFVIHDLQPSTGYRVRITAHNAAGSSVNTYSSTTLPSGQMITFTFIDKYLFI